MGNHSGHNSILTEVTKLFANLLGRLPGEIGGARFVELGVDSLLLLQAAQQIQERFGVRVPFRALLDDLSTVEALAAHLDVAMPSEAREAVAAIALQEELANGGQVTRVDEPMNRAPKPSDVQANLPLPPQVTVPPNRLEELFTRQLQVMEQQLQIIRDSEVAGSPINSELYANAPVNQISLKDSPSFSETVKSSAGMSSGSHYEPSVPYKSIDKASPQALPQGQQELVSSIIHRLAQKTSASRTWAEKERSRFADSRATAGFRMRWKEISYPIVASNAEGSHLWDLDGNEYIDITMGFGALLFGHSPTFIIDALKDQVDRGICLGPQSRLAGEAARLLCELTGSERATFTNSGTEAVMVAARLARTVTGRDRIAIFSGCYHGSHDEVLVRADRKGSSDPRYVPIAPGISRITAGNAIVLEFCSDESLRTLRREGKDLAAILVEPIPSRRPDAQAAVFLSGLRQIADEVGAVLIFDEVISGIRMHPQGAQGLYNIRSDITIYGKAIGGGMPLGAVAGRARYLDAVDGGGWSFGDSSYPGAETTFVAGTYFKHPMAMAAAVAVLRYVSQHAHVMYEELESKAEYLADSLNGWFEIEKVPMRVYRFGSLFRFWFENENQNADVFYHLMLEHGVYIWENRVCYLSTAHTIKDLDTVLRAVKESVKEMRSAGMLQSLGTGRDESTASSDRQESNISDGVRVSAHPEERVLPTTLQQKELWLLSKMAERRMRSAHSCMVRHFHGTLDVTALHVALQSVVDRHEALRTVFTPDGEFQRILTSSRVDMAFTDLVEQSPTERKMEFNAIVQRMKELEIHLETGPLIRFHLVKLGKDHHALIYLVHHIVADGSSTALIMREMSEIYAAIRTGVPAELPAPMQYTEFAEKSLRQSIASLEKDQKQNLSNIKRTTLPLDRPRHVPPTFRSARTEIDVSNNLWVRIKDFSSEHGCTPMMTTAAALQSWIYRITSVPDVAIGLFADERAMLGNRRVVGHCVSLLPLQATINGSTLFVEHLRRVKEVLSDAYERPRFSLASLITAQQGGYNPAEGPIINVCLNLEQFPRATRNGDLEVSTEYSPNDAAWFDLVLNLGEGDAAIVLSCDYASDLFDESTVQRYLRQYVKLLESAVEDASQPVSRLAVMDETEKLQIREAWNPAAEKKEHPCAHRLFELRAEENPAAVALQGHGVEISYGDLNARAEAIARHLGEVQGRPVAVLVADEMLRVASVLGVMKSGAVFVCLDGRQPQHRLKKILDEVGAVCVAHDAAAVSVQSDLLRQVEGEAGPRLLEVGWQDAEPEASANMARHIESGDPVYVVYTSGSSGEPKGIVQSHGSFSQFVEWFGQQFGMGPGYRVAQWAGPGYDAAYVEIMATLAAGGTLCVAPHELRSNPEEVCRWVREQRLHLLQVVPSFLREMMAGRELALGGVGELKVLAVAGEVLDAQLAREWLARYGSQVRLYNLYGPTETILATCYAVTDVPAEQSRVPVGRGIPGRRIAVLDEHGQLCPIGVPGEIWIAGSGLTLGYWNRPEETAKRFVTTGPEDWPEPSYRTGDLGRWRADGNLEYCGRLDDQVKIRGMRVEPGEVEAALLACPGVRECAVTAQPDKNGQPQLIAWIVTDAEGISSSNVSTSNSKAQTELWPSVAEYFVYDDLLYHALTNDHRRNHSYKKAISRHVKNKTVVEIGTGADAILAQFCVEAGAERVYAIEILRDAYERASESVRHRGLQDRIHLIHGDATKVTLPELGDVGLSELVGSIGSCEGAPYVLNETRKLLKPESTVIPCRSVTHVAAVALQDGLQGALSFSRTPEHYVRKIFDQLGHPFDLRVCVKNLPLDSVMSTTGVFEELDFRKHVPLEQDRSVRLSILRDGSIDGFLLWLNLSTAEDETINILDGGYCWLPVFFPAFWPRVAVHAGDVIEATCKVRLSDNGVNPDYEITGQLSRGPIICSEFTYFSGHHGTSYRASDFYRSLFGDSTNRLPRRSATPDDLRTYLSDLLPEAAIPLHFSIVTTFPRLSNGKLDRTTIAKWPPPAVDKVRQPVARSRMEQVIGKIWEELLGLELVNPEDDFFELGGHSLLATQAINRLRDLYGPAITVALLFETSKLSDFAIAVQSLTERQSDLSEHDLREPAPAATLALR